MKYLFRLLILLFIIQYGCKEEDKKVDINTEIAIIENSLTKSIHVKDSTVETFTIEERMAHYNVPGMSMAIVRNGKLHWAKAYGIANTQNGSLVNTETLFQAGSISKPIAAIAPLQLMEKDIVDLDSIFFKPHQNPYPIKQIYTFTYFT